jgi:transcriptional regulator with PAS, ATPase and Fis domain
METNLQNKIKNQEPFIGAAVGSGMSAKAAENGDVDFLMVLSAGHFRLQGCSSSAALMPFSNANELTWKICQSHVLPQIKKVPIFMGLCAQDPIINFQQLFQKLKRSGVMGVTNFPSVGFFDGHFRQNLEEIGLGYGKEVQLLKEAKQQGLMTIAFAFNAEEVISMLNVGVDIICLDLGFAEWRSMSEETHQNAVDESIRFVTHTLETVKKVHPKPSIGIFGGPIVTARDFAELKEHTDIQGYIGGSTFERFPATALITQTVREFQSVAQTGLRTVRLGGMMGRGQEMQKVFEMIQRVAETDVPVLILGESGTGKELAAREIHRLSHRRNQPMVSWNCGALTETLANSELFGHEKGAFTGATSRRIGHFEQANGSTLFMDEVTDLPHSVQARLLRVIQERELSRVGDSKIIPVDVRLVAATNKNLPDLIKSQEFRLDLYYRLSTVVIHIPSLRERTEDIPFLVREFIQEFSQKYNYPIPKISARISNAFMHHHWPGNIRELRNTVERCVIMGRGEYIRTEWLNDFYQMTQVSRPNNQLYSFANEQLKTARERLPEVLQRHNGNKAAAAKELGVTRKTIYSWLKSISE